LARKEGCSIELLPPWEECIFPTKKEGLLVLGEGPIFVSQWCGEIHIPSLSLLLKESMGDVGLFLRGKHA
jgi:hypothetical protein